MPNPTENHEYNHPAKGTTDWHIPLNDNFAQFDTDIELRDQRSNRSNYTPKAGAKFVATDTEEVFVGDGSSWTKFETSGKTPRFSGVDVGGTDRGIANFVSPGGEYAVYATSNQSSLGSAAIGVNTGDAGDGIQAISENDGRSGLFAQAEGDTDYGVLSLGNVAVGTKPTFEVDTSGSIQFDTSESGGSRAPMMYMYTSGTGNADQPVVAHSPDFPNWGLFYDDENDNFEFRAGGSAMLTIDLNGGNLTATGEKNFVQTVDTDAGEKEVVYTATEAGTPHTEVSGVAHLEDGRAEIDLPEHFAWVTDDEEPLTVQVTPHAREPVRPQVTERSTHTVVVEDFADGTGSYEVSYTVKGTRDGYEDKEVVRAPR